MYPIKTDKMTVTSRFGYREYMYQGKLVKGIHYGIDLIGGQEIVAFDDGFVIGVQKIGEQYGTGCFVRLRHNNGFQTLYYHLKTNTITVNVGDNVKKGQFLGIIGTTGQSTGVHLHFQIDEGSNSSAIDPHDYIFNNKQLVSSNIDNLDSEKSIDTIVKEVILGIWGNGQDRKKRLSNAGFNYNEIQALVNESLKPKIEQSSIDILELVNKTIKGEFGNGEARKNALGSNYDEVQRQVNLNIKNGTTNANNIRIY